MTNRPNVAYPCLPETPAILLSQRKSKEENETILSELRAVRGKLLSGKKDLLHLTKELRAIQNEGRHGGGCNANPSVGSLLDAAQEKPGEKGGDKSWVLSMKSDGARVRGKEKNTRKSAPTKRGLGLVEVRDADGNARRGERSGSRGRIHFCFRIAINSDIN